MVKASRLRQGNEGNVKVCLHVTVFSRCMLLPLLVCSIVPNDVDLNNRPNEYTIILMTIKRNRRDKKRYV